MSASCPLAADGLTLSFRRTSPRATGFYEGGGGYSGYLLFISSAFFRSDEAVHTNEECFSELILE